LPCNFRRPSALTHAAPSNFHFSQKLVPTHSEGSRSSLSADSGNFADSSVSIINDNLVFLLPLRLPRALQSSLNADPSIWETSLGKLHVSMTTFAAKPVATTTDIRSGSAQAHLPEFSLPLRAGLLD